MKTIRNLIGLLIFGVLIIPAPVVRADAAPPREPPGSSILPAGQTMVQMLAESVVIVVGERVQVEAVFALRNQGEAEEKMDVRFPMESPDGYGDGWGEYPQVSQFEAFADGRALPITYATEPWGDGKPIAWANFPVTFPPGKDVSVSVSYTTPLGQSNAYVDQAMVEYILQTGAGWYGTIESAVITLRLPYAASESNVYVSDLGQPMEGTQPVFVGREVRWEWSNLEPTQADNLRTIFVFPDQWQNIIALEGVTGANPADVDSAIKLAEAYRDVGSERHGAAVSEPLYRLAKQAVQMGLAYNPDSPKLDAELLVIELWWCNFGNPACTDEYNQSLLQSYEAMLAEQPDNQALLDMSYTVEEIRYVLNYHQTPTVVPTVEPIASPTGAPPMPTPTLVSSAIPNIIVQTVVVTAEAAPLPPATEPENNSAMPFALGAILGALAMLGLVGLMRLRRR